jgi:hypothetical protein
LNVNEHVSKRAPLTHKQRARDRCLPRARAIGEHPFLVVKRAQGHTKARHRALRENLAQIRTLFG